MDDAHKVEVVIFLSDRPVTQQEIKATLKNEELDVSKAIESLNTKYETAGLSFRIQKTGRGYAFATLPEYEEIVGKFLKTTVKHKKLTKSAIETLSIIAYKQPVKRQEIDSVRGASSQDIIKLLLEQELVSVEGREKGTGALLYKTTDKFLELTGIGSLEELPKPEEL